MRDDQPLGVVGTHQHATTRGSFGTTDTLTININITLKKEMVYLASTRDGGKETQ